MSFYVPGALIAGRYEVVSQPLQGGMGIVYICLDRQDNYSVALKTFKPEYLPDRTARDRFLREGAAWVALGAHPHIVRCYQVFYEDPTVFLVLELIAKAQGYPDASLRSWLIPGHPLPVETALLFALQIARGMQYAKERLPGFVHRDLKPENILVGADKLPGTNVNCLRVTDFGLAAVLESTSQQINEAGGAEYAPHATQLTQGAVGTPEYMAPEQWENRTLDARADVYALGCSLLEMLSGQMPVRYPKNRRTCRELHQSGTALQKAQALSGLPEVVTAVLQCCLAVDPAARYDSWNTVVAELTAACATVTGQVAPFLIDATALSQEERVAAGWSYYALGQAYVDIGKAASGLTYFERSQRIATAEGVTALTAASLNGAGNVSLEQGDPSRARALFAEALRLARQLGDRQGEGAALGNLGIAYKEQGDLLRAMACQEEALALAQQDQQPRAAAGAWGNLGIVYRLQGDLPRALECHEQDRELRQALNDRRGEANAWGNLGNVYSDLGEIARAMECHQRQVAIAQELGDRLSEALGSWNLGLAYERQGALAQAVQWMQRCVDFEREVDHPAAAADAAHVQALQQRLQVPATPPRAGFWQRVRGWLRQERLVRAVYVLEGLSARGVSDQARETHYTQAIVHLKENRKFAELWARALAQGAPIRRYFAPLPTTDREAFTQGLLVELALRLEREAQVTLDVQPPITRVPGLDRRLFITGGTTEAWRWGVQVYFDLVAS